MHSFNVFTLMTVLIIGYINTGKYLILLFTFTVYLLKYLVDRSLFCFLFLLSSLSSTITAFILHLSMYYTMYLPINS